MSDLERMKPWAPTGALRWNVPNRTTTRSPVLEQEWRNSLNGHIRWDAIPVFVDDRTYEAAA